MRVDLTDDEQRLSGTAPARDSRSHQPQQRGAQARPGQQAVSSEKSVRKKTSGRSAEEEYKEKSARKLVNIVKAAFHEPVFIVSIVLLLFILLFMRPFLVPSGSMQPTLKEGDRVMSIARYFPSGSTYARGDIACFIAPSGDVYVKRIIGIGGDHIQISGEKVLVNGEESPYQGTSGLVTSMDIYLADDEYWVMGDNRGNSQDSRFIGPVKADKMISRVIAIYFPFDRATLF